MGRGDSAVSSCRNPFGPYCDVLGTSPCGWCQAESGIDSREEWEFAYEYAHQRLYGELDRQGLPKLVHVENCAAKFREILSYQEFAPWDRALLSATMVLDLALPEGTLRTAAIESFGRRGSNDPRISFETMKELRELTKWGHESYQDYVVRQAARSDLAAFHVGAQALVNLNRADSLSLRKRYIRASAAAFAYWTSLGSKLRVPRLSAAKMDLEAHQNREARVRRRAEPRDWVVWCHNPFVKGGRLYYSKKSEFSFQPHLDQATLMTRGRVRAMIRRLPNVSLEDGLFKQAHTSRKATLLKWEEE